MQDKINLQRWVPKHQLHAVSSVADGGMLLKMKAYVKKAWDPGKLPEDCKIPTAANSKPLTGVVQKLREETQQQKKVAACVGTF